MILTSAEEENIPNKDRVQIYQNLCFYLYHVHLKFFSFVSVFNVLFVMDLLIGKNKWMSHLT